MGKEIKRYGFITAVSMVVGSVIGSGIFFKAETLSRITGGNGFTGVLAWVSGGAVMLLSLLSFSLIASHYASSDGLVEISNKLLGEKFAYYTGWFMATIYYPSLTSVLGWLSARYTLLFLGIKDSGGKICVLLSCVILGISFCQNILSTDFSGKFQVITAIIKLTPLVLIIICGIPYGVKNGVFTENFRITSAGSDTILPAVRSTLFAYEGWIVASSIGKEMKNPRKLPMALITGGVVTVLVYILYYIGIMCCVKSEILINYGAEGVRMAYDTVLGEFMGKMLTGFVAVSCIGALNGMMMGLGRGMYFVANLGKFPCLNVFKRTTPTGKIPVASFVMGLFLSFIWLFFTLSSNGGRVPFFRNFHFDCTEMPVASLYVFYIPLFVSFIKKYGREKKVNIIIPFLGICACVFTLVCALASNYSGILSYLCTFAVIILFGEVFSVT